MVSNNVCVFCTCLYVSVRCLYIYIYICIYIERYRGACACACVCIKLFQHALNSQHAFETEVFIRPRIMFVSSVRVCTFLYVVCIYVCVYIYIYMYM